ncbi:MAG: hypothetical protein WC791_03905 [Candidatus Paceibacterota bacterium]|jgi:hypothetical protein
MKKIFAVLFVVFSVFCGPVYADDCDDTSWITEVIKSYNIGKITVAQEKLRYCTFRYAGIVNGIATMQAVMMSELEKDPTNETLRRLIGKAKELAEGNWKVAKRFSEIHNSLNVLIEALRQKEKSKKKDVEA